MLDPPQNGAKLDSTATIELHKLLEDAIQGSNNISLCRLWELRVAQDARVAYLALVLLCKSLQMAETSRTIIVNFFLGLASNLPRDLAVEYNGVKFDLTSLEIVHWSHSKPLKQFVLQHNIIGQSKLVESQAKIIDRLTHVWHSSLGLILAGPSGSGKSFLIDLILKSVNAHANAVFLSMTENIEAKSLLGNYSCKDSGEFTFELGILSKCMDEGRALIVDSIDKANLGLQILFSTIIEKRCILLQNGRFLIAKKGFLVIGIKTTQENSQWDTPIILNKDVWLKFDTQKFTDDILLPILKSKYPNIQGLIPKIQLCYDTILLENNNLEPSERFLFMFGHLDRLYKRLSKSFVLQNDIHRDDLYTVYCEVVDCFLGAVKNKQVLFQFKCRIAELLSLPIESTILLSQSLPYPKYNYENNILCIGRSKLPLKNAAQLGETMRCAFTNHFRDTLQKCARSCEFMENVLLNGETGNGKTLCIQTLARLTGNKIIILNLSNQTEVSDLIGGFRPIDKKKLVYSLVCSFKDMFKKTFPQNKNEDYLHKIDQLYHRGKYIKVFRAIEQSISMLEELKTSNKKRKLTISFLEDWRAIGQELKNVEQHTNSQGFAFGFADGPILDAMKSGSWLFLDEINVASPEVLDCVYQVLHSRSLLVPERGSLDRVEAHPNFRLFAAMNPATDVGKRPLANAIQNSFIEFWVSNIDEDESDLWILIESKIGNLIARDKRIIKDIIDVYKSLKACSRDRLIVNGAGMDPHFTFRSLARCLEFVSTIHSVGLRSAIHEGFALCFLSNLDTESEKRATKDLESHFPRKQPEKKLELLTLDQKVQISFYSIEFGVENIISRDDYILTDYIYHNILKLVRAVSFTKFPILLQGPTSAGKTSMIEFLANISGNKFVRINNHENTDTQEYIGLYASNESGNLQYQEGLLLKALRLGHWLVLDELNLAPSDVLEALNRLLDDNRELYVPEIKEVVKPHPRFMLFATQNPVGFYGGRKQLSRAFQNRFIEINFEEIPDNELLIILEKKVRQPPSYLKKIIEVFKTLSLLRSVDDSLESKKSIATLRDVLRWAQRPAEFLQDMALNGYYLISGRLRNEDERSNVRKIIGKIFKVHMDSLEPFSLDTLQNFSRIIELSKDMEIVWTNAIKKAFVMALKALENSEPVLLVGETGAGKTSLCQLLARINEKRLHILSAHQNLETSDIIGSQRPSKSRNNEKMPIFDWEDGSLTIAMQKGEFFLLDEITLAEDSVLERLNSVLEHGKSLTITERGGFGNDLIIAKPTFRFLATMNPGGDYGKRELSRALRNRFTEIWVESNETEQDYLMICHSFLGAEMDQLSKKIIQFIFWYEGRFGSRIKTTYPSIRKLIMLLKHIRSSEFTERALQAGLYALYIDCLGAFDPNLADARILFKSIEECKDKILQIFQIAEDEVENQSVVSSSSFFTTCSTAKQNYLAFQRIMQFESPILLEGSPGVGKTSLIIEYAKISGQAIKRINLSEQTDFTDLIGSETPDFGESIESFSWKNAPLLEALINGKWVLLDEINLAPQPVLEGLNSILDHRKQVYIPELSMKFSCHPNFRVFAAQNPYYQGGSRNGLPKSFIDRFITLHIKPFGIRDMLQILETKNAKMPSIYEASAKFLSSLADLSISRTFQEGNPFDFNLRDLYRFFDIIQIESKHNNIIMEAYELAFRSRFRTDQDRVLADQIFNQHFNIEYKVSMQELNIEIDKLTISHWVALKNGSMNSQFIDLGSSRDPLLKFLTWTYQKNLPTLITTYNEVASRIKVEKFAAVLGFPVNILTLSDEFDVYDLIGSYELNDSVIDSYLYKMREHLVECFKNTFKANFLELIDEIDQFLEQPEKFRDLLPHFLAEIQNYAFSSDDSKFIKLAQELKNNVKAKFVWRNALLLNAISEGNWVIVHYGNVCSSSVLDRLNPLLEQNGFLEVTEMLNKTVSLVPHPNFRIIFVVNPKLGELSRPMRNRCAEYFDEHNDLESNFKFHTDETKFYDYYKLDHFVELLNTSSENRRMNNLLAIDKTSVKTKINLLAPGPQDISLLPNLKNIAEIMSCASKDVTILHGKSGHFKNLAFSNIAISRHLFSKEKSTDFSMFCQRILDSMIIDVNDSIVNDQRIMIEISRILTLFLYLPDISLEKGLETKLLVQHIIGDYPENQRLIDKDTYHTMNNCYSLWKLFNCNSLNTTLDATKDVIRVLALQETNIHLTEEREDKAQRYTASGLILTCYFAFLKYTFANENEKLRAILYKLQGTNQLDQRCKSQNALGSINDFFSPKYSIIYNQSLYTAIKDLLYGHTLAKISHFHEWKQSISNIEFLTTSSVDQSKLTLATGRLYREILSLISSIFDIPLPNDFYRDIDYTENNDKRMLLDTGLLILKLSEYLLDNYVIADFDPALLNNLLITVTEQFERDKNYLVMLYSQILKGDPLLLERKKFMERLSVPKHLSILTTERRSIFIKITNQLGQILDKTRKFAILNTDSLLEDIIGDCQRDIDIAFKQFYNVFERYSEFNDYTTPILMIISLSYLSVYLISKSKVTEVGIIKEITSPISLTDGFNKNFYLSVIRSNAIQGQKFCNHLLLSRQALYRHQGNTESSKIGVEEVLNYLYSAWKESEFYMKEDSRPIDQLFSRRFSNYDEDFNENEHDTIYFEIDSNIKFASEIELLKFVQSFVNQDKTTFEIVESTLKLGNLMFQSDLSDDIFLTESTFIKLLLGSMRNLKETKNTQTYFNQPSKLCIDTIHSSLTEVMAQVYVIKDDITEFAKEEILNLCQKVLNQPIITPLGVVLKQIDYLQTSLEKLLSKNDKKIFQKAIEKLNVFLSTSISMEIKSWLNIFEIEKVQILTSVSEYWFPLYGMLVNEEIGTEKAILVCSSFLNSSTFGDFEFRIQMLKSFSRHCIKIGKYTYYKILNHFCDLYSLRNASVQKELNQRIKSLEEEATNLIKTALVSTQKFTGFNTIFSRHRQIFSKFKRKFVKVLQEECPSQFSIVQKANMDEMWEIRDQENIEDFIYKLKRLSSLIFQSNLSSKNANQILSIYFRILKQEGYKAREGEHQFNMYELYIDNRSVDYDLERNYQYILTVYRQVNVKISRSIRKLEHIRRFELFILNFSNQVLWTGFNHLNTWDFMLNLKAKIPFGISKDIMKYLNNCRSEELALAEMHVFKQEIERALKSIDILYSQIDSLQALKYVKDIYTEARRMMATNHQDFEQQVIIKVQVYQFLKQVSETEFLSKIEDIGFKKIIKEISNRCLSKLILINRNNEFSEYKGTIDELISSFELILEKPRMLHYKDFALKDYLQWYYQFFEAINQKFDVYNNLKPLHYSELLHASESEFLELIKKFNSIHHLIDQILVVTKSLGSVMPIIYEMQIELIVQLNQFSKNSELDEAITKETQKLGKNDDDLAVGNEDQNANEDYDSEQSFDSDFEDINQNEKSIDEKEQSTEEVEEDRFKGGQSEDISGSELSDMDEMFNGDEVSQTDEEENIEETQLDSDLYTEEANHEKKKDQIESQKGQDFESIDGSDSETKLQSEMETDDCADDIDQEVDDTIDQEADEYTQMENMEDIEKDLETQQEEQNIENQQEEQSAENQQEKLSTENQQEGQDLEDQLYDSDDQHEEIENHLEADKGNYENSVDSEDADDNELCSAQAKSADFSTDDKVSCQQISVGDGQQFTLEAAFQSAEGQDNQSHSFGSRKEQTVIEEMQGVENEKWPIASDVPIDISQAENAIDIKNNLEYIDTKLEEIQVTDEKAEGSYQHTTEVLCGDDISGSVEEEAEFHNSMEIISRIDNLALRLSQQLSIILEPTKATKYKGDFKSGKRINLKRIIPFIISNYQKDKIWLRRVKPFKRDYQILLSVDTSESMSRSEISVLTVEAVALIVQSFKYLETGKIGILGFDEEAHIIHDLEEPLIQTRDIIKGLKFKGKSTNVYKMMNTALEMFRKSINTSQTWKFLIIVSDGIFEDHLSIRKIIREMFSVNVVPFFVIVDSIKSNNKNGSSILELTQIKFTNNGNDCMKISRYIEDEFPFDYYVVVDKIQQLPNVLSTTLRKWFSTCFSIQNS